MSEDTEKPDFLKMVIRGVLLLWFLVISLFVFCATWSVFPLIKQGSGTLAQAPVAPQNPTLSVIDPKADAGMQEKLLKANERLIEAHKQQVTAYTLAVATYKASIDGISRPPQLVAYEVVVKGTLASFFTSFVATLLAFVFANAGIGVIRNVMRMRRNEAPVRVQLL